MTKQYKIEDIIASATAIEIAIASIMGTFTAMENAVYGNAHDESTDDIFNDWSDCNHHIDALRSKLGDISANALRIQMKRSNQ